MRLRSLFRRKSTTGYSSLAAGIPLALAACLTIGFASQVAGQVVPLTSPTQFTAPTSTINFDDFPSGTAANTLYSSLGVTFSNFGTSPVPIYGWLTLERVTTSQPNVIATVSGEGASQYSPFLDLTFSSPKTELGAYFGNDQGVAAIPSITLSVFNAANELIGSVSVTPNGNTSADQFIGLRSSTPFVRARFENTPDNFYSVVLDDVIFSSSTPSTQTIGNVLTGVGRPFGVAVHGGHAYVADPESHTVWKINLTTKEKTPVAGIGWNPDVEPQDRQGYNGDGIDALQAQLDNPSGVAVDSSGNIYIADTGNHAIRKIGAGSTFITTVAGIPTSYAVGESTLSECLSPPSGFDITQCVGATSLRLFGPRAVAVDQAGNVYIADRMNQQVKKLHTTGTSAGFIFVVAGVAGYTGSNDGPAVGPTFCPPGTEFCDVAARLNSPVGVAIDGEDIVYIADEGNNSIRKVTLGGNVSTLQAGGFLRPTGVAVSPDGATVYIADYGNHQIRRAECSSDGCAVTTVAGTGTPGLSGAIGDAATTVQLNSPIALTLSGNLLYIADMLNGRILAGDFTPPVILLR